MKIIVATTLLAQGLLPSEAFCFTSSLSRLNFRHVNKIGSAASLLNPSPVVRFMSMDLDIPPPQTAPNIPVLQSRGGEPVDVRYSDFLKLVNADRIEKVTFAADGTKLLGVDVEGTRLKIEALPNDPDLLTQLTNRKVRF